MQGSVRKKGNRWYYSFEAASVDGKRKRIERAGGNTKKEAEAALRKAIDEYENAGNLFKPSDMSVSDYMDYWMKNYVEVECAPNTISGYRGVIKNHIKPKLGHYKLKSLSTPVLNDFILGIYNSGYTRKMLIYIKTVISGALNYAVTTARLISTNPMVGVKVPSYKKGGKKGRTREAITIETFNKLISRFQEGSNFYIPLMLGFHAGLRIGEAYALTWEDIDLKNGTINVNKQITKPDGYKNWFFSSPKYDSFREIGIGTELLEVLRKERKKQLENEIKYGIHYTTQYAIKSIDGQREYNYVMQSEKSVGNVGSRINLVNVRENGQMMTPESFKYASRVIRYELEESEFDYHTLRHTHTTLLIEHGADVKYVSERLGHKDINTTLKIYTSVTDKMRKNNIEILDKITSNVK